MLKKLILSAAILGNMGTILTLNAQPEDLKTLAARKVVQIMRQNNTLNNDNLIKIPHALQSHIFKQLSLAELGGLWNFSNLNMKLQGINKTKEIMFAQKNSEATLLHCLEKDLKVKVKIDGDIFAFAQFKINGLKNECLEGLSILPIKQLHISEKVNMKQLEILFPQDIQENKKILTFLEINSAELGSNEFKFLIENKNLQNIKFLNIPNNKIGKEGMKYFKENNECLPALQFFFLSQNQIGDEGVEYLSGSNQIQRLRGLNLAKNGIKEQGIKSLINSNCTNLESLNLGFNILYNPGTKLLIESNLVKNLKYLNIERNYFDHYATSFLTEPNCKFNNLEILHLSNNKVGATVLYLVKAIIEKRAPKLKEIFLLDTETEMYESSVKPIFEKYDIKTKMNWKK